MTKHILKATKRTQSGRKVKLLRLDGFIPASLFGKSIASQNLTLSLKEFSKIYALVGESGLVYLNIDSEKQDIPVIFSEVSFHPVSNLVLHVSLRNVSLSEKIKAPVKIELTGKSPAVSDGLGVLVQQMDEIEIEALPQDFPENITIDVSSLTQVNSSITVSDLKLGSKMVIITDPTTIIVKIDPLAKEEPVATLSPELPNEEAVPTAEAPATDSEK